MINEWYWIIVKILSKSISFILFSSWQAGLEEGLGVGFCLCWMLPTYIPITNGIVYKQALLDYNNFKMSQFIMAMYRGITFQRWEVEDDKFQYFFGTYSLQLENDRNVTALSLSKRLILTGFLLNYSMNHNILLNEVVSLKTLSLVQKRTGFLDKHHTTISACLFSHLRGEGKWWGGSWETATIFLFLDQEIVSSVFFLMRNRNYLFLNLNSRSVS